jgi:hypothetical protein
LSQVLVVSDSTLVSLDPRHVCRRLEDDGGQRRGDLAKACLDHRGVGSDAPVDAAPDARDG